MIRFPFVLLLLHCLSAGLPSDRSEERSPEPIRVSQVAGLLGTWNMVAFEMDGVEFAPLGRFSLIADKAGRYVFGQPQWPRSFCEMEISPAAGLNRFDYVQLEFGELIKGIIECKSDQLRIAYFRDSTDRPESFLGVPESDQGLVVFTFSRMSFFECIFQDALNMLENQFLAAGDFLEDLILDQKDAKHSVGQIYIDMEGEMRDWKVLEYTPLYPGIKLHFWRLWYAEFRLACTGLFECDLLRAIRPRVKVEFPMDQDREFLDMHIAVRAKTTAKNRVE